MTRAILILCLLTMAGCGGGGDKGYRDPETLAARLHETAQARMDTNPGMYKGAQVTETKCVESGRARVFKCSGEISTGDRWTISVTVSEDGKTYVSDSQ